MSRSLLPQRCWLRRLRTNQGKPAIAMKWTRSLNSWPGGAWFANRQTPQVAFYRETHLLVEMIPTPQKNVCARGEALGSMRVSRVGVGAIAIADCSFRLKTQS